MPACGQCGQLECGGAEGGGGGFSADGDGIDPFIELLEGNGLAVLSADLYLQRFAIDAVDAQGAWPVGNGSDGGRQHAAIASTQ